MMTVHSFLNHDNDEAAHRDLCTHTIEDELVRDELWQGFENVCDMLTLKSMGDDAKHNFPCFERMDVITSTGRYVCR